ncbi:MAG: PsiF family protein [Pseudolabrys sp.]
MLRTIAFIGASAILLATVPASAAPSAKQKMATCQFGAKDQKLTGAKRTAYIKRCMANEDSPRGPAPAPK